jgi:hypothetical protein
VAIWGRNAEREHHHGQQHEHNRHSTKVNEVGGVVPAGSGAEAKNTSRPAIEPPAHQLARSQIQAPAFQESVDLNLAARHFRMAEPKAMDGVNHP